MTAAPRAFLRLAEYRSERINAAPPTEEDLRLARTLQEHGRLTVRWLAGGDVEVLSSSWVGVVRFSSLDIAVEPKLVGGDLRVLRMLEYASGVDLLRRLESERPLPPGGSDLFELLCLLLKQETESLLLDGVLHDYRNVDDTLDVLRGRLRVREQYLHRFGRIDVLECRFDEYTADVPDNQYVTAALGRASRRTLDPQLRWSLAGLHSTLAAHCTPPSTDARHYRTTITYGRLNERYRRVHELAGIVLDGLAYNDLYDTSDGRITAFLLDMNTVFERFITRLVTAALETTDLRVAAQKKLTAVIHNDDTNRSHATIVPDLVIEAPTTGRAVPIDVKYKTYDTKKVSTADVYQSFIYAYALGAGDEDRRAGILFPSAAPTAQRLSVTPIGKSTAARIIARGINVPAALDALHTSDEASLLAEIHNLLVDICRPTAAPALDGRHY